MDSRAAELVAKAKAKLDGFVRADTGDAGEFDNVYNYVAEAMNIAFGASSQELRRVTVAMNQPLNYYSGPTAWEYIQGASEALRVVDSITEIHAELRAFDVELAAGLRRVAHASNSKVFVVHGHHDALRESVARFLERAKLEPIILAEQASGGNTIIEKLEANSDVAYSVVLLTADDVGGSAETDLKPRARQNVVFELGYFVGLLARSRVCALVEEGVEIFSDISGVTYIPVDPAGAWKAQLAKELSDAGLAMDLTALI
tara:strand:- start:76 stop:852 length:777 start_codon:yes stop_codon:yes gene_type:complete